jgi:hypothetical protein
MERVAVRKFLISDLLRLSSPAHGLVKRDDGDLKMCALGVEPMYFSEEVALIEVFPDTTVLLQGSRQGFLGSRQNTRSTFHRHPFIA